MSIPTVAGVHFFLEIISPYPTADGLVARGFGDLFPHLAISRAAVQFQCRRLQLRRTQFQPARAKTPALRFRATQHRPRDPGTASRRIDIHSAQLHRVGGRALQTEHANQDTVPDRDPEPAVMLPVIIGDPANLFRHRPLDIGLERIACAGRRQQPIDQNE